MTDKLKSEASAAPLENSRKTGGSAFREPVDSAALPSPHHLIVSERQKKYEDGCREIADELGHFIESRGIEPKALLAKGNLIDLFNCIRTAYLNGRADERKGETS